MIPLHDDNPTRSFPLITWLIVAVNVLVYILQILSPRGPHPGLVEYAMVPLEVVTGRQVPPYAPVHPPWLTIFTSMFMHGGLLHIGSNMLYLAIFGNNVEDRLGHFRFLIFYLACGFLAAVAHILSAPFSPVPTLGASGAVAGVLGAYFLLYPHAHVTCLVFLFFFVTTIQLPAVIVLGFWIIGQILSASSGAGMQVGGGIAYWAHIGGFFAGMLLISVMAPSRAPARRRYGRRYW